MEILIAGGGIGGLTAALALDRAGVGVRVVEAAERFDPLGVGINLLPHGAAVLWELGLGPALDAAGIQTRAIEYRTRFGQLILSDARGRHAGFPWPQYSIHRADLHRILHEAAQARFPDRIHLGLRLDGFDERDGRVTARLVRRADGGTVELTADALVGADGIHSRVCRILHGEKPFSFADTMMWRGCVEQAPFLDGETMVIAGHHAVKSVIYPISREARERGRSLVNWTAELAVPPGTGYEREDWNRRPRPASSPMRSRGCASTSSTCRRSTGRRRPSSSTRWSTATPCRAGASAG